MKLVKNILLIATVLAALATSARAGTNYITMTRDVKVSNVVSNEPGLLIQKPATMSTNFVEFRSGSTLVFSVGTNGFLGVQYGGTGTNTVAGILSVLGFQSGTNRLSNSSLVTNTFSPAYTTIPVVTVSCNVSNATPYISSVSTSNVVLGTSQTNVTLYWRSGL